MASQDDHSYDDDKKDQRLSTIQEALEASTMKHLDLADKNSQLKSENASLVKEIERLQCKTKEYLTKIKTQEADFARLRLEADKLQNDKYSLSVNVRDLRSDSEDLQAQIRTYQQENRYLGEEKEALLLRLSKIAGANLTYNNPNIADLSDEKRPSKLSEEFSELYDNEWTDAFEEIEAASDETKTRALYCLLKHANEYCKKLSEGHNESIIKGFTTLEYVRTLPERKETDKTGKLRTQDEPSSNLKDSSAIEQSVDSSALPMTEDNADNKTTDISVNEDPIYTSQPDVDECAPSDTHHCETVDEVLQTPAKEKKHGHDVDKNMQDVPPEHFDNVKKLELSFTSTEETVIRERGRNKEHDGDLRQNEETAVTEDAGDFEPRQNEQCRQTSNKECNHKSMSIAEEEKMSAAKSNDLSGMQTMSEAAENNISNGGKIGEDNVTRDKICDVNTTLETVENKETDDQAEGSARGTENNSLQLEDNRTGDQNDGNLDHTKPDENDIIHETDGGKCYKIVSDKERGEEKEFSDAVNENQKHAVCEGCGVHSQSMKKLDKKEPEISSTIAVSELECEFEKLNKEQLKIITDIKKMYEEKQTPDVIKVGAKVIAEEMNINMESQEIMKYISKCIDICWSMHRHVPPVHIYFPNDGNNEPFDTKMYRAYTKSGKYIHFVVWPAIHLHEEGPLLSKGVAQGRD